MRSYTSRSNGESSAVRPSKSSPRAAGSTRHCPWCPRPPPARRLSATSTGSIGIFDALLGAMPSEASRRSFLIRSASSIGGDDHVGRVHALGDVPNRSRPTRPEIATWPRMVRNSSIWVTLRLWVQPVEAHGTAHVSGMSREVSGPELLSCSRMSRRNPSLSRTTCSTRSWLRLVRACRRDPAPRSLIGRTSALRSYRACGRARAPAADAPAGTPSRAGSRRRGRHWGDGPRSGRSASSVSRCNDREQVGRPRSVEQLRAHRDAPGLRLCQLENDHRREVRGTTGDGVGFLRGS